MFGLGPMELMIVGGIALLLFGNNLPSVMRSLGRGISEFKKEVHNVQSSVDVAASAGSPANGTPANGTPARWEE